MNLSFSTRGWPDLGWDEMIDTALSMGFGGIEVYNLPKFNPLLDRSGPSMRHHGKAMRVGGLDLTRLLYYEAKNVTVKNMVLNSYQSFIKKSECDI